jgi:hypothetical protein
MRDQVPLTAPAFANRTFVVDGVDGPLRHHLCQNEVVANLRQGSRP